MASTSEYEQQQFWEDELVDIRIRYRELYNIITYRVEAAIHKTIVEQSNKSTLPKEYTNGK